MTAISGVAGSAGSYTARGVQSLQPDPMREVAKLLDMTPAELRTQLQTGQTLAELATGRNVSESDLAGAVQASAPPGTAIGVDDGTAGGRASLEKETSRVRPTNPAGTDDSFQNLLARTQSAEELTEVQRTKLDNLSSVLQMETPLLLSKLSDGMDLFTLAQQQGVGVQVLGNFLEDGDLVDVLL